MATSSMRRGPSRRNDKQRQRGPKVENTSWQQNTKPHDVFICHHGHDAKEIAIELRKQLSNIPLSSYSAFVDEEDLHGGVNSAAAMDHALQNCSVALVLFTRNFFTSDDCKNELRKIVAWGVEEGRFVYIPVFLFLTVAEVRAMAHDTAGKEWADKVMSKAGIRHKGELSRGRQKTLPDTKRQILRAIGDHFEGHENSEESDSESDESQGDDDKEENIQNAFATGICVGQMLNTTSMRASYPPASNQTIARPGQGHPMSQQTSPMSSRMGRPLDSPNSVFGQSHPARRVETPEDISPRFWQALRLDPFEPSEQKARSTALGRPPRTERPSSPTPPNVAPTTANRLGATGREVHRGVQCDFCNMVPIIGPRYKSTTTENVDSCAECHAKAMVQAIAGPFVRVSLRR